MFDIKKSVDFDSSNRAICPACSISKGIAYKAKNLSVAVDSSAYKCHRGCASEEIRAALGEERDRQVPAALAKPPAKAQLLRVFPSQGGLPLDSSNFRDRHWECWVKPLAQNRKIDWYLPPSHTRHTFITLALQAGVPVADVSKLVGNSAATIWKHYAQANRAIVLPDF